MIIANLFIISIMITEDIIWLLESLPLELVRYIIASYNPLCFFIMHEKWILDYDWRLQCKATFDLADGTLYKYFNMCRRLRKQKRVGNTGLYSCGDNSYLQLGVTGIRMRHSFEKMQNVPTDIVDMSCGTFHTIILLSDGTLMGCGANDRGQLGFCDTVNRVMFEVIPDIPKDVVQITCGHDYTIILRSNGVLMATGYNIHGQLGMGDINRRSKFETITSLPSDIVDVSASSNHVVIMRVDGTLMSCGNNAYGQLGLKNMSCYKFTEIGDIPKDIMDIYCCLSSTFVTRTNGTLMYCGRNPKNRSLMQLLFKQVDLPKDITHISSTFKEIFHVCSDGMLVETNSENDLAQDVVGLACGANHTIIMKDNGTLLSYGGNRYGQRGCTQDNDYLDKFVVIDNAPKNIIQIGCGSYHTIVMTLE